MKSARRSSLGLHAKGKQTTPRSWFSLYLPTSLWPWQEKEPTSFRSKGRALLSAKGG